MSASAADDMMLVAALLSAPDGSGTKLAAMAASYCGRPSDGEAAMQRLKTFGCRCWRRYPMSYCALNAMLDGGYPKGALNYWKSHFLRDLSDGAIEAMIDAYSRCPSPMSGILLRIFTARPRASALPTQPFP